MRRSSVKRFVLDSFALLAHLQNEPGAIEVRAVLEQASDGWAQIFISLINLGEALYYVERRRGADKVPYFLNLIEQLPLRVVSVTPQRVYRAAHLKATYPISYADCFAAGLAQELKAEVLTGDPEFRKLGNSVQVRWLPQR